MKKTFLFITILLLPVSLFSQLTGSGTWQSPYTGGTLVTDLTWDPLSDTVYVNGDITIGNSGHLTIAEGIFIKFLSAGSDMIFTGTGQLTAIGTPAAKITFTADHNKNKVHGESGETWGHLSFQGMGVAATSNIEYCLFEYGRVVGTYSSGDPRHIFYGFGGAIYTDFSGVIINNCTFKTNYANFGGAIAVEGVSPSIAACIFSNNNALEAGGALLLDGGSTVIENCIFQNNHSSGVTYSFYSGGAIFFGPGNGTASAVVNCTFVNNTSDRQGDALYFYSNINYQVKNSILWGSNDQTYNGGTNIINCAIEGSAPSGSVNCIALNSSNTNALGPNFTDPNSNDWSIKVISPCLDAGTSSGAPSLDYLENSRVRNYDIGAFEVQYNYWLTTAGTTDWATGGNWNGGVPTNSQNIVIPAGATRYPTGSSTQDFEIGAGKGMVLEPGAKVTLDQLTSNGDLRLRSDASNISSLIVNSNGVNALIDLFLSGGGNPNYKWHYVSSPVASLPVSTFAPTPTIDFAQYFEARPTSDPMEGWIGYDGYKYSGGGFLPGLPYVITGTNLAVGQGYNYYKSSDYLISFSGSLNTSDVEKGITFGGDAGIDGFNLLGNPFSSGLNWTTIINDAGYPGSTSKGLYFTRNNAQCSFIAGVGYPDASVTGIIPPMQGFFIHTDNTSTTITLPASARAHNIPARYKGTEIIPLVRLQLDSDSTKDNTVVRFDLNAKTSLDNDFDAVRMFLSNDKPSIYSSMSGIKYAINGQPFPESFVEIPIVVNITTTGNHIISSTEFQGLDEYTVTLKDNTTGFVANLKTVSELSFSASAGTITDRFVLKFAKGTTGIEDPVVSKKAFNIYLSNSMVNVQTLSDNWVGKAGTIRVLDITGKTVNSKPDVEFSKNNIVQIPAPGVAGIYLVEVKSGLMRHVGKVVIR